MAQIYSTALVNMLTGGRNLRSILDNFVIRILSGAAPASADGAETGTLLCIVSKSSGFVLGATAPSPLIDDWYFTMAGMGPTAGKSIAIAISLDGVNGTYTYNITGTDGSTGGSAAAVDRIANMINQAQRPVRAIGFSGPADVVVLVTPTVRGLGMTLVDGGGNDTITPVHVQAAVRYNTLQLGPPVGGIISKLASDTMTGTNLATGVAGYFRVVLPDDTFAIDSAISQVRVQGSVGTSGADMNLDSVQFNVSATTTISGFSIQEPTT
jgi:hypothetical protein